MRRQVWSLLLGDVAERGTTVLVSSHNLRELEDVCDHVGILSHGRVLIQRSLDDLQGNIVWQYDSATEDAAHQQNDPYTLEHVNWISCIRNNTPIVQAEETATSNMCAIMGRESAYTGKSVSWDEMTASPLNLTPAKMELGPMDMSIYTVPVPGTGK